MLRFDRVPDSVQTDHIDWGFRLTTLYGIDYRWTTSQGWFSEQLLKRNALYGADPVEVYGLFYFPHVAQGMMLKVGRYISPPDIEAQLAPELSLKNNCHFCFAVMGATAILESLTV